MTTTPSWIATLSDPVLRLDMEAAASTGTITEAAMLQTFTELGAELTAGNMTLSASQFSDLKTIAANLNVGVTASPYLVYVVNALVNGNTANTTWTGGATHSVPLGNLAVGSSATTLNELTGKWLAGSDLPSSSVYVSPTEGGIGSSTISYSDVSAPLFGASGPVMSDVNQGSLADCYLESVLADVAYNSPSTIESMIISNTSLYNGGIQTYGIRFFIDGEPAYETVNSELAGGGTDFNHSGDVLWASLIEKAYAQLQTGSDLTGGNTWDGNSYSSIGNGGNPLYTLEEVTGVATLSEFGGRGTSWEGATYNSSLDVTASTGAMSTTLVTSLLVGDLALHDDVILNSNTNAYASSGMQTLAADHAMSVYGYDSATGDLEVRNPWGTSPGQTWDTTFEVSLSTLLSDGDTIDIADISANSNEVSGAQVSSAASLQADATVASFSVADTLANVLSGASGLTGDTRLASISLTDAATPSATLTAAQYTADDAVLGKIASAYHLTVSGAPVSEAAGLQANAHVAGFTVAGTAADVTASISALNADGKLTAMTITGTSGPDTLNLTGSNVPVTINMDGDLASVSKGLSAPSLSFIGTPDAITLGTGVATIDYALKAASGVETIANFQVGRDVLDIDLEGLASSVLKTANTTVNGVHSISIYDSATPTVGVVLTGMPSSMTAATLLASHTTFGGGGAVIV
jgi:hypothetical protein